MFNAKLLQLDLFWCRMRVQFGIGPNENSRNVVNFQGISQENMFSENIFVEIEIFYFTEINSEIEPECE